MKKLKKYFPLLLALTCLYGCKWPDDPVYNNTTYINITIPITINPSSSKVDKDAENPSVIFHGYAENDSHTPIEGVNIRIVGTDLPECRTTTLQDGSWKLVVPIIPRQSNEDLTTFVIEVQKEGCKTRPLADLCNDPIVWELLGVQNPKEYMVAAVSPYNVPWENLHEDITCSIIMHTN